MAPAIQIYCRRPTLGEMEQLVLLGVEYLAWHIDPSDGDAIVQSRWIIELARRNDRRTSLLVHSRKVHVLRTIAELLEPSFLLLSSDRNDSDMPGLARAIASTTQLMMSVPVCPAGVHSKIDSVALALQYAEYAGALTVDTVLDPTRLASFGCTGVTNDWSVARRIVEAVSVPVVLAGGLAPANVAEAARAVKPAIVDACTALELSDKSKSIAACASFVAAARSTTT
jgi:phosphoribosylanthranilate isomerase